MDDQLLRIKEKLDRIRKRWFRRRSFGEEKHHYELKQPLPETVLNAFESEQGVRLPEEYRQFLLHLGNGGAGPGYGILPLEAWREAADDDSPADYLARPCPLQPDMPRTGNWLETIACSSHERYAERYQGTIALCHQGCTYYGLLVVSGPARGRIVNIDLDDTPPLFVRESRFLAWYERWLDEVLKPRKLGEVAWFGYDEH